ncbi:MAG: peptidoglycan-binding protein [Phycisphaerae bacterium]|jgi:hypothetical protein
MMGDPRSGSGQDDFQKRLERSLQEVRNKPKREAAAPSPAAPAAGFEQRLKEAMSQSQGGGTAEPARASRDSDEHSGGPVGQGDHVVRQGECISSIAKKRGLFWENIWNDAANSELRSARKSPNVLLPGDRVTIPDKERKDEPIAPEERHRFVRRGEPSSINMCFTELGKPLAGRSYEAYVDGKLAQEGSLDGNGGVEVPLPSNAARAEFVVYDEHGIEKRHKIQLRQVPPISELCGVQARLNNLGYPCGHDARRFTPMIARAVEAFQRDYKLPINGLPDETMRKKLVEVHGC